MAQLEISILAGKESKQFLADFSSLVGRLEKALSTSATTASAPAAKKAKATPAKAVVVEADDEDEADDSDDDEDEDEEFANKKPMKGKSFDDEDEDEADDSDEAEDEDEAPAKSTKGKKAPAKSTKGKKAPAKSFADEDEDEDEDEESDSDDDDSSDPELDEDEAPVKPAKKAAAAKTKKLTVDDLNDASKDRIKRLIAKGNGNTTGKEARDSVLKLMKKNFKVDSVNEVEPKDFARFVEVMSGK